MPSEKTLILVRHAQRDTYDKSQDNGLNEKGKAQAKALLAYFKTFSLGADWQDAEIFSSPKKRCIETVEAIADYLRKSVKTLKELDEQKPNETTGDLIERIQVLKKKAIQDFPPHAVICSHGDWIPLFLGIVTGREFDLKKGGWIHFRSDAQGHFHLQEIIQDWK